MDERLYNEIKEKYGKDASWAIWNDPLAPYEDPFTLGDYQKVEGKLKPNYVLVGFNPSGNIYDDFSNFHNLKDDPRNLHINAIRNANKLKYAFINTEYEGAYMTDIIKLAAIKEDIELANSAAVKKYIKEHPEVEVESIRMFKEELEFIGSKNPFIIALGGDAYDVLMRGDFTCKICKVTHYSHRVPSSREEYKELVWKEIENELNGIIGKRSGGTTVKKNPKEELIKAAEETLDRFKKVAGDRYIMDLDKSRETYIYILRDREKIGCVKNSDPVFEYHNSHPLGTKRIRLNDLTDEDIEDAILNTHPLRR